MWLVPDAVDKLNVEVGWIAIRLAPGYRRREDVTGDDLTLCDHQPNAAEDISSRPPSFASESVEHTTTSPTRIILPIRVDSHENSLGAIE